MKRTPASFSFGGAAGLPAGERMPPRPDRGRIGLRAALLLCLLLAALPAPPAVAGSHSWALLHAGLAWLSLPPAAPIIAAAGLGGAALLAIELVFNASWLVLAEARRTPAAQTYLRIRSLRPQSRKTAHTAADPAELWRSLHAALQQPGRVSGPAPWVAFTLHAQPDEPAALGALVAAGAAPRQSLRRALTSALLALDAEVIVDEAADPLAAALQPGRLACWCELALSRPPHAPIRTPDTIGAESLGALAAALRTPPGVAYTEIQIIARPRPDRDAATPWRVWARRRLVALRRAQAAGAAAEAQALEAKLSADCYDVSVRLVAVARDRAHTPAARAALRELCSAFGQFQARGAAGVQQFRPAGWPGTHTAVVPSAAQARRRRLLGRAGLVLAIGAGTFGLWAGPGLAAAPALVALAALAGGLRLAETRLAHAAARAPRSAPPPALLLPAPLWAGPLILSCAEAAGLWHLPGVELKTLIGWLPNRHLPAAPHTFVPAGATDRIVLGHALRGDGSLAPVGPTLRALRQVLHLTAGMGTGKTRALANMARQLIPNGLIELDGKGDDLGGSLAATTLSYIPLADEARLVIVDVLDAEWPVGLNPLHGIDRTAPGGITQTIGMILAVFARLDPETWAKSQGMQQYAQMSAALIAETVAHPTLAHLKQAIQSEQYRAELLAHCTNIEVKTFWEQTFPRLGEQQKASRDALLRRLDNLMVDETTRYLIAQPLPTIDFLECMEHGRIVVLPLPHRTLGGIAEFVGMLLLQAVLRAAFRRPGSDQTRSTVPLIVDELQVFVGQGQSRDMQDAITQLRGFGIGGIYAHQTLAQLGTLRDEMLTNSANRMILRTLEPDASAYASLFPTTDLTAADISGQPADEHQYVLLAGGAGPAELCSIRPLPWPAPLDTDRDLPPYHGPGWQSVLPGADARRAPEECTPGAAPLEALIARMIYGPIDPQHVAAQLARLPDDEWAYLCARWDAIRRHQRQYILDHPSCIALDERLVDADPERQALLRRQDRRRRRQQWLSRLETRTPRVLAAAGYARQRWATT